jgi:hypothetical protein
MGLLLEDPEGTIRATPHGRARASDSHRREGSSGELGPVVTVHASERREPFARGKALASGPRLTADGETLASTLAAADKPETGVRELQDLGSTLTRLLEQRRELGPAAADSLARLHDRRILFQVSRALRAVAGDPLVHERLLEEVASAPLPDASREAAIGALGGRGDRAALDAFASVLSDAGSGPLARSACAYELARELDLLPEGTRAGAVASARALASDGTADPRVRAEAWGVLGAQGLDESDRARARAELGRPDAELDLALAAARALLVSGEPRDSVARSLASRAQDDPELSAMVALLERKDEGGVR